MMCPERLSTPDSQENCSSGKTSLACQGVDGPYTSVGTRILGPDRETSHFIYHVITIPFTFSWEKNSVFLKINYGILTDIKCSSVNCNLPKSRFFHWPLKVWGKAKGWEDGSPAILWYVRPPCNSSPHNVPQHRISSPYVYYHQIFSWSSRKL